MRVCPCRPDCSGAAYDAQEDVVREEGGDGRTS
jgi:hypothetical protein